MSKPLLSIGMIIKNEMRCIERCLKSLQPLRDAIPCQLIIADTGSTDGTREIATRYADVIFDFPWINDFAAARNAVLDRCTGEWYLTIDADEWLEDTGALRRFLLGKHQKKYNFVISVQRNYQDKDLSRYSDFYVGRMARIRKGQLRYQNPIHETLFYSDGVQGPSIFLPDVVEYHDGYLEVTPGHQKEKNARDMLLLRSELAKNPQDLRLLVHCCKSTDPGEEQAGYVERMRMRALDDKENPYSSVALQHCMIFYGKTKAWQESIDCYRQWRELWPDSPLLAVDGEAMAACAAFSLDRETEALDHICQRRMEKHQVKQGRDLTSPDRFASQYFTLTDWWQSRLHQIEVVSLLRLGRYEEAEQALRKLCLEKMQNHDLVHLLVNILEFWDKLRTPDRFLARCWALGDARPEEDEETKKKALDWRKTMNNVFRNQLQENWERTLAALAELADTAPGVSARIILSEDPVEVSNLWTKTDNWGEMFNRAYFHTVELELPLPDGFYSQGTEILRNTAATLGSMPAMPRALLRWINCDDFTASMPKFQFLFDLTAATLRAYDWGDADVGERLVELFCTLSADYLANYYNPALLADHNDRSALPGLHRFALNLLEAQFAEEEGNELRYVRSLKSALSDAPAMRKMVGFLLEHRPQPRPAPEMQVLAERVKAVLAQYSPDDPAVTKLKQSKEYQKVAPMLQQRKAPTPARVSNHLDTKTDAPIEKVEQALAGTQKEIEAGIASAFARLPDSLRKKVTDYWVKYPLWGKTPEEVRKNTAAAFSQRREDFLWMFRRMEDGLSRRIFSAVVRNWRYFETEPLRQVIDTCYDDYFDLDLLHCDENEVVVDVGAFVGDTFLSYIRNYGPDCYKRYYAYEITPDSFAKLKAVSASYPRVICRRKGVGDSPRIMALDNSATDASANALSKTGNESVEIVTLDDNIREPITLLKMDIEGAEQNALTGCLHHIREDRPKLALSVYHNFKDIWKLARIVENVVPGVYRFYLRYHGGNLWPSEITLLGLPEKC